jgi:hypothetical protein
MLRFQPHRYSGLNHLQKVQNSLYFLGAAFEIVIYMDYFAIFMITFKSLGFLWILRNNLFNLGMYLANYNIWLQGGIRTFFVWIGLTINVIHYSILHFWKYRRYWMICCDWYEASCNWRLRVWNLTLCKSRIHLLISLQNYSWLLGKKTDGLLENDV